MDTEAALLEALHDDPADEVAWRALADWLEESGQPDRAELLRLDLSLRAPGGHGRRRREQRLQELLASGVRPCVPILTNSVGLALALIPAGSFRMGSPRREKGHRPNEAPRRLVTLTRPFYLGVYPVTQAQYRKVTARNPSHFAPRGRRRADVGDRDTRTFPVDSVSWDQAVKFCARLGELPEEKAAGRRYRLPTEAEWEYACRAGTSTPFHFGDALPPCEVNNEPPPGRTCPVGSCPPNAWGLFDLHGNVWEWVADWYGSYANCTDRDPEGVAKGDAHVLRGGGWFNVALDRRAAIRGWGEPRSASNGFGLRVCLGLE